jgi:hypothetical protein
MPLANVSLVDIGHKLAYNMGWNYYRYGGRGRLWGRRPHAIFTPTR